MKNWFYTNWIHFHLIPPDFSHCYTRQYIHENVFFFFPMQWGCLGESKVEIGLYLHEQQWLNFIKFIWYITGFKETPIIGLQWNRKAKYSQIIILLCQKREHCTASVILCDRYSITVTQIGRFSFIRFRLFICYK